MRRKSHGETGEASVCLYGEHSHNKTQNPSDKYKMLAFPPSNMTLSRQKENRR